MFLRLQNAFSDRMPTVVNIDHITNFYPAEKGGGTVLITTAVNDDVKTNTISVTDSFEDVCYQIHKYKKILTPVTAKDSEAKREPFVPKGNREIF